ncbi:MAG: sugar ABC transporter substrate-binding protein [Clostridiaceae bacterium]|nr:sugar ABC transporter substrate-binding protein [Clostridiaceae bacterium]
MSKLNALQDGGVPVVTFSSDLQDCNRLCFIGQDLVRGGRVAGELMSKSLLPNDHLLIAIGNPEFQAHRLRLQGFCERLYENGFHGNALRLIETYNDYALTCQKVSAALAADPSIQGIYMANHSVSGCAEAVRNAGICGRICIISHDLTIETQRLLQQGEIDFTIAQNLYQQSYRALIVLQEYLQKHIIPQQEIPLIDIICAENIIGRI